MRPHALARLAALALFGSATAFAQDMPGMKTSAPPTPGKTGHGVAVIHAIDPVARTITLQHGPIPNIGWPAMTMTFKADPAYCCPASTSASGRL